MDSQSQQTLLRLIRTTRTGALGTLRTGAPEVSMALIVASSDCTKFYFHASRLAHHTQNILRDARVGVMLAEGDDGSRNPQTLARVSIQGEAILLEEDSAEYKQAQSDYLAKFPEAEMNFGLGDFGLYRIEPRTARFVAGFGQIFNLTLRDFAAAGAAT